jgi:antitoxin component of MazEF toxin-antitoxin module
MVSPSDSTLSDTAKKLSRNIILNSQRCSKDDLDDILRHNQTPTFLSAFTLPPFSTTVRKIGKTHGFILPKKIGSFLQLQPDDEVQLILQRPYGEKRSTPIPTKRELQSISEKYAYYFKFQPDVTLDSFNFEEVGNNFHIPIYTRLRVNGTSFAFYVTIEILEAFGFSLDNPVDVIIRKVQT